MVEARSTSITTATPPRSAPGGIELGNKCTNAMRHVLPRSHDPRERASQQTLPKIKRNYGTVGPIWGAPAGWRRLETSRGFPLGFAFPGARICCTFRFVTARSSQPAAVGNAHGLPWWACSRALSVFFRRLDARCMDARAEGTIPFADRPPRVHQRPGSLCAQGSLGPGEPDVRRLGAARSEGPPPVSAVVVVPVHEGVRPGRRSSTRRCDGRTSNSPGHGSTNIRT